MQFHCLAPNFAFLVEQNTCLRRYILGQGKAMGLLEHGNVIKLAGISNGGTYGDITELIL